MSIQLFDNSFKESFEDYMTVASILESATDKEKVDTFFKSVLPHTVMEQKLQKLVDMNKSVEKKNEEKNEVKILSKSFKEEFEKACK